MNLGVRNEKIDRLLAIAGLDDLLTQLFFGGALIRTPERFAYGERVDLWLPLLGPGTVSHFASVVRWCDDSGFGVQFLAVGAREAFALTELALADALRLKQAKTLLRRLQQGIPS